MNQPAPQGPARFSPEWISEVIGYHSPDEDQLGRISSIRFVAHAMLSAIIANCPDSADRTTAIRHVRDAMMTANASIALKGLV